MSELPNMKAGLDQAAGRRTHEKLVHVAIRTSLVYWILSALWILFSDRAVFLLSPDPRMIISLSIYKGWGFVTLTAVLLYIALRNQLRRWEVETEKRVEAEKALGRYELLANHARDLILFVRKDDARIIEANATAIKAYGYTREELLSLLITDLRAPGYKSITFTQMEEADKRGILFETFHVRKDGSVFPVEVNSQGIDLDGTRVLVSVIRDITDRRGAEQQLLIKNSAIESSISAIGLADMNGKIFYVNKAFVRFWGYDNPSEVVGRDISEFTLFPQKIQDAFALMQTGKGYLNESKGMKKDGTVFDLQISANIVKSEDGRPICSMASFIDIAERKAAEKRLENMFNELKRSEEKYRSLFEESKDAIFISETNGSITDVNPAGIELLGFDLKDELTTIDLGEVFVDPEERQEFYDILQRDKFVKDHELMFKKKSGEQIIVNCTASVVVDESKETPSFLSIIRDITKQKAIQHQLTQAQRMESVGTLAAGIAHDFNNILGIIMGHSTFLGMAATEPEKARKSIDAIQKATARGAALVNQLLTFARKTESVYERVEINDIVDEVTRLLEETLPKTIAVVTDLKPDLPSLHADPTQMQQVLLNLCVNARDAMPIGGSIRISTEILEGSEAALRFPSALAREYILLKITDTGIGMDEDTKRRIFDPFYTTKEVGKGTGLGLALVHSIVTSHNGFIDVATDPGNGTTFSIYLPVHEGGIVKSPTPNLSFEEAPGGTGTILLIEDEEMLIDLAKEVLTSKGYNVLTARDGISGIELFTQMQNEISVVISDLGLPKLSGDEVLIRIRSIDPSVKLIAASGYVEPQVKSKLLEAGVKHFVQKPYLFSEILQTIRDAIDEKE